MKTNFFSGFSLLAFLFLSINNNYRAGNEPVSFTENLGQWNTNILFRATLDGGTLFMEHDRLTFNFYDKTKLRQQHHNHEAAQGQDHNLNGHAYQIRFLNSTANPIIEKLGQGSYYENFYLGADKNKWRSNVRHFETVWYRNLYEGIDYEINGQTNGFKYNFHVAKNVDPGKIRLKYEGITGLSLKDNVLTYKLSVTSAIELKPYAFQMIDSRRKEIPCRYVLRENIVSFDFPEGYNKNYALVIDPVLVFAAQSGSAADNFGMTATWDAAGNFYSGGTAFSNGYPITVGAYTNSISGSSQSPKPDVVISKFGANGSSLIYSTYFGGSETEIITSMIVDHSNNLCFYGATGSANLPTTSNAYDNTYNGGVFLSFFANGTTFSTGTDIFVGKFNSTGSTLLACTFIGGSNNDGVNHLNSVGSSTNSIIHDSLQYNYGDQYRGEIQVDGVNNIYIASSSRSSDYPVVNAFDNTLGGKQDAVISKFNSSLTNLLYSTYLGGSLNDCGNSLVVLAGGDVVVTGGTCSGNFPVSSGAYKQVYSGGKADGFISELSTTAPSLINSSFIGTNAYDQSYFVQSDKSNNIYVYGQSMGAMPLIGSTYNNPGSHQFISKFNSSLTTLLASTTIGNNTSDIDISPSAFSVDHCGNIYLSGWGGTVINSNGPPMGGMPLMSPTQFTTDGYDVYFMALGPNMSSLLYGSYFGGSLSREHVDGGTSRIDKAGVYYQAVCAGCGGNDDFPVTPGAWPNTPGNPNHSMNCNAGILKIASQTFITAANIHANVTNGCAPLAITLSNASVNYSTFTWYLPGSSTNTTSSSPSMIFTTPGTYSVSLVVQHPLTCNLKDSSTIYINVGLAPTVTVSSSHSVLCAGESATLTAQGALNYQWGPTVSGSVNVIYPGTTTTYTVSGYNSQGCEHVTQYTQNVSPCTHKDEIESLQNDFFVHPNPTNHSVYIQASHSVNNLRVFDLYGRVMAEVEIKAEKQAELNFSDYSSGIYFIVITYENGTSGCKKVIRE